MDFKHSNGKIPSGLIIHMESDMFASLFKVNLKKKSCQRKRAGMRTALLICIYLIYNKINP
jgi:hypothetical protein